MNPNGHSVLICDSNKMIDLPSRLLRDEPEWRRALHLYLVLLERIKTMLRHALALPVWGALLLQPFMGEVRGFCATQVTRSFTEPYQRIDVSAAELGIVTSLQVRVGEHVKKGQLLGELNHLVLLESRKLAKQRAESTARIDAARADLELKESHYRKLTPLLASGHANAAEIDRSKSDYHKAEAAVRLAADEQREAAIELKRIEAQLLQRQIRSPIDGIVINLHRQPGEYLPAADPRFATVVNVSKLSVRFFVTTRVAETLSAGLTVQLLLGEKQLRSRGVIEFVSPVTESESSTVRVDVVIENRQRTFRSGIPCELVVDASPTGGQRNGHD